MSRQRSRQKNPYLSPVSEFSSYEEDSEPLGSWQSWTQQTPFGRGGQRSFQHGPLTDVTARPRCRRGCRNEQSFSSSTINDMSSGPRRITKSNKAGLKLMSQVKVSKPKRPKGPRTVCDIPGCNVSVARAVDIQRHKKVKHGDDRHKFTCLLCKKGQSSRKSKENWVFGLKYNLME